MLGSRRTAERVKEEERERSMRAAADRAVSDPDRLDIVFALSMDGIARWCSQHGYRCVTTVGLNFGVIAQRGGEIPLVARVGDALVWDGERLAVEEA